MMTDINIFPDKLEVSLYAYVHDEKSEPRPAVIVCPGGRSALRTLNRWINGCPLLVEELRALQYQPRRHTFLPREVEAIVRHLGEP